MSSTSCAGFPSAHNQSSHINQQRYGEPTLPVPLSAEHMPSPTVDIIVPVWNSPEEARSCLSAILSHSPEARLIIIDNGSNRQTQLVLEEFIEPLGERCLFLSSDRNEGLVRAINRGLARSDNDFSVIVRPHVRVTEGWLPGLIEAAETGIASPLFTGAPPFPVPLARGCSLAETFALSFSALAVRSEVHMLIGGFDEQLDGGLWCLRDFICRAGSRGYRTRVTSGSTVVCGKESLLGSETRRHEVADASRAICVRRWGEGRHYGIYFGRDADTAPLAHTMETVLACARRGHRFTLFLHPGQAREFRNQGWNSLHTSIEIKELSRFMPRRDLQRALQNGELIAVRGTPGAVFGDSTATIPFSALAGENGQP